MCQEGTPQSEAYVAFPGERAQSLRTVGTENFLSRNCTGSNCQNFRRAFRWAVFLEVTPGTRLSSAKMTLGSGPDPCQPAPLLTPQPLGAFGLKVVSPLGA